MKKEIEIKTVKKCSRCGSHFFQGKGVCIKWGDTRENEKEEICKTCFKEIEKQ